MGQLKFEQIKLTGFKSFVEPTSFNIKDGLTGIVGPNGCGKSNLLEAIRWVMGANSAKAMRAGAMDDVIFSGTNNRPGRGQADVVLTIDNSARIAPPMFNESDELEVQRIIKKGGGSKYKVNGKTVRAKDVQLLFADASTGANSPALVRQGQINELISAKPANRRRILEEAAGISGLHSRRHEAELRLRAAENNLDRLDDILQQIEAQLVSLRRQSRQAARFKRLAGEIREYKALLWLKRWTSAIQTLAESQQARGEIETKVQELTQNAAEKTRIAAEISTTVEPKREAQIIAAAVVARLNAAKDALQSDEESARAEIEKLAGQIKNLAADLEREQSIIDDAAQALETLKIEKGLLSSSGDRSADIAAAQKTAETTAEARSKIERDYSDMTGRAAAYTARKETAGRDLQDAENRLHRLTREHGEWSEKLATLKSKSGGSANLFEAAVDDHTSALTKAREAETAANGCTLNRSNDVFFVAKQSHGFLVQRITLFRLSLGALGLILRRGKVCARAKVFSFRGQDNHPTGWILIELVKSICNAANEVFIKKVVGCALDLGKHHKIIEVGDLYIAKRLVHGFFLVLVLNGLFTPLPIFRRVGC